ncbi:TfoX/Sxy family protein [Daejeonella lutea]|uniref:TfoX N-terminal domain-containing protein n=1 Tax=Daejeonella lutea TaxID=572036 RepID=A0A1T5CWQ4_9SPHI|nr:TfoX/Sxy family protein [Daejeonella lutea]SKB63761.1 TfoX N-terminal domain-containing protein [Daejeonella lutea]
MPYNIELANRLREYLGKVPRLRVKEKKMFGGLAFMVSDRMCINVSGDRLMCRFDPKLEAEIRAKAGYEPMIMRGKELRGYCYVREEGYRSEEDFKYWVGFCLDYNGLAG